MNVNEKFNLSPDLEKSRKFVSKKGKEPCASALVE